MEVYIPFPSLYGLFISTILLPKEMEKRRRDKINFYLNELAELVPAALEKKVTINCILYSATFEVEKEPI